MSFRSVPDQAVSFLETETNKASLFLVQQRILPLNPYNMWFSG